MRIPPSAPVIVRPLLLGLVLGLMGALAVMTPAGRYFEEVAGLPWLFHLRGPAPPPSSILVASIDAESARALGHKDEPWKWPRSQHARLVDRLREMGARVVVFDLHFEERRAEEDRSLATALRRAGNVVLVEELRSERYQTGAGRASLLIHRRVPPTRQLAEAAWGSAPFPLPKVPDRVTRVWLQVPGGSQPTLPVLALEAAKAAGDRTAASALERIRSGRGEVYLGYYGPPGTVPQLSYADLLRGDPKSLRLLVQGRAVFVGASERLPLLTPDEFRTPFSRDGSHLSGVEILATAYANLLSSQLVHPLDPDVAAVGLLLFGLLLGVAYMRLPAWLLLPSALLFTCAWGALAVTAFAHSLTWLPLAIPLSLQIAPGLLAALLLRYGLVRSERERLGSAFGRYLPARAVRELAGGRFEPARHCDLVQGVCLYTDAEQYTSLSEGMAPMALRELLNEYYSVIFEPVRRHGGFVSDVVGDAMLALWATRRPNGGPRRSACEAALDLVNGVTGFNSKHPDTPLPTRVGIHCGRIVLGNVGAEDHYEYRAVGDIVNTASRLEGLNKRLGTRVLVTDDVIQGLEGFVSREVGLFRFKGKREALRVHELIGRADAATASDVEHCARFGEALSAFRARRWAVARTQLRRLTSAPRDDRVIGYYISLCERFISDPPHRDWDGAIVLTDK
jgi:adenylate cyclase